MDCNVHAAVTRINHILLTGGGGGGGGGLLGAMGAVGLRLAQTLLYGTSANATLTRDLK